MKPSKIFSILVFTMLLSYGLLGYYFLPLASFEGDLTRIGMMPESAFGWRQPQPALEITLMEQASMTEADVLVIGDSFSDGRVWQTELTRNGYKVRTESWGAIRAICADFMPWLKAQGFRGKYIVLQTVERYLVSRLRNSIACQSMNPHTNISASRPRYPPATIFNPDKVDRRGRFSVGIRTWLNLNEYQRISRAKDFVGASLPSGVKIARVANGCKLFSHRSCNDILLLGEDSADDIDVKMLELISRLEQRMVGVTPIWVFVPNKSTTYLYPNKQFWNKVEQRFNAPNLLRMTQEAIARGVVDLYPANNTHFSTTGYLLMGKEILKAIRQAENLPPKSAGGK